MFNWRSFKHFLDLRMKSDAQLEVRDLAQKMLQLVNDIPGEPFKHTIEAFGLSENVKEAFYPPY
jgi:thymidylate synthase ThyX